MYKVRFLCIAFACIGIANAEKYGEIAFCSFQQENKHCAVKWAIFDFGGKDGVRFASTMSRVEYIKPVEYHKGLDLSKGIVLPYEIESLGEDEIVSVSKHGAFNYILGMYPNHKQVYLEKVATKPPTSEEKRIDPKIPREETWTLTDHKNMTLTMQCMISLLPTYDPEKMKGYSSNRVEITKAEKENIKGIMDKMVAPKLKPPTDEPTSGACAIM